jgi:hypothetical protein
MASNENVLIQECLLHNLWQGEIDEVLNDYKESGDIYHAMEIINNFVAINEKNKIDY